MANQTLNLDLSKSPILKSIIYGRIGDSDMQTVTVNITSRDVPVNLTGYTITFEGITNGHQTKVFDVGGIKSTPAGLALGKFEYTFPNMAFAVAGNYEIAYFSIAKGNKRDTTGEFDIIVESNADIDAEEAKTIITEYNKLVGDLHSITDKYISDSDTKFMDINAKIVDLQAKISQYQTTVKNTADSAVSTINTTKNSAISAVNTSSNAAIEAVDDALKKFKAGNFYTKEESDSRFAPIQMVQNLAALSQTVDTKASSSEVVHITGDETIAGRKTFTETLTVNNLKVSGDTDRIIPLTMASGYTANAAEYCIKGGWIFITVQGARPTSNKTGSSYYTFLKLPPEIVKHLSHTEAFMWSNFQGGGTAYSGGILNTGDVQLYASPSSATIGSNHRYSFNMVIPLRNT